mmetsp:Transcript_70501/g.210207  ORF Transcript_70501/g.210207 Transcript_70501/m.210207 type:complete len:326 (+) Transcript_70501:2-979(+)
MTSTTRLLPQPHKGRVAPGTRGPRCSVEQHLRQACAHGDGLGALDAGLVPLQLPLQALLAPHLLQPPPHLLAVRNRLRCLLLLLLQGDLALEFCLLDPVFPLLLLPPPVVYAQDLRRVWVFPLQGLQFPLLGLVSLPPPLPLRVTPLALLLLERPLEGLHLGRPGARGRRLRPALPGLALRLAALVDGAQAAALHALEELLLPELPQSGLLLLHDLLRAPRLPLLIVPLGDGALARVHLPLEQELLVNQGSPLQSSVCLRLLLLTLPEQVLPLLHGPARLALEVLPLPAVLHGLKVLPLLLLRPPLRAFLLPELLDDGGLHVPEC